MYLENTKHGVYNKNRVSRKVKTTSNLERSKCQLGSAGKLEADMTTMELWHCTTHTFTPLQGCTI